MQVGKRLSRLSTVVQVKPPSHSEPRRGFSLLLKTQQSENSGKNMDSHADSFVQCLHLPLRGEFHGRKSV